MTKRFRQIGIAARLTAIVAVILAVFVVPWVWRVAELAPFLLTFQHRAGVTPYTSSFDLAESCVFDKQSPGPIRCV